MTAELPSGPRPQDRPSGGVMGEGALMGRVAPAGRLPSYPEALMNGTKQGGQTCRGGAQEMFAE